MLPTGLSLAASPQLVDVGEDVTFTLSATSWQGPSQASLSFVSPHHGFTGTMIWENSCGCFRIAVALARRIHSLEGAKATATVHTGKNLAHAFTSFTIRGLARNGRDYAPGGAVYLSGWVSDPRPAPGEYEHFCGWAKTVDGLGVTGLNVRFVAHYPDKDRTWNAGVTGPSGVVCSQRAIGKPAPGLPVRVDVFAGTLRAATSFTPRA